ncbi:unnamed protein product, partial [Brassica rapa subsp. trilocularis]
MVLSLFMELSFQVVLSRRLSQALCLELFSEVFTSITLSKLRPSLTVPVPLQLAQTVPVPLQLSLLLCHLKLTLYRCSSLFKMAKEECPGIRRSVWKEEFNMDMFEEEFGAVVVTGAEGWSAQHGEASLNSGVGVDDGDEVDSQPAAETQAAAETETQPQLQTQTQRQTQTHSGSSRGKRRRKEKDMVVEACDNCTEALMVKNKRAERMLERQEASMERQEASSVENVLEILYTLPGVRE